MGRPSKLSEKQWSEIRIRVMKGESPGAIAKDYKVGRTTIADKFPAGCRELKELANQIVTADSKLNALPLPEKIAVMTIIDDLKAISMHLAGAAKFGSATAHRLAGIANMQVCKIDDVNPMDSQEVMQGISALTKMANDASVMGLALINSNKEKMAIVGADDIKSNQTQALDTSKLSDSALRELMATRDKPN